MIQRTSAYLILLLGMVLILFPVIPAGADFPGNLNTVSVDLIPDEVIIEYFDRQGAISFVDMQAHGKLVPIGEMTYRPVTRYLIKDGSHPMKLIPKLEKLPGVKAVYPNLYRYGSLTPVDSLYGLQKDYYALLNLEEAWDIETGSASVTVAVIDTGIDPDHPELKPNLIPGVNVVGDPEDPTNALDDSGHGTAVAGVIGAIGNNSQGVAGVAWNVKILPIRTCAGPNLICSIFDEVEAIDYAREAGVDIINMSIGGIGTITLEEQAATAAWNAGISMFSAAGNSGKLLKATGTPEDRQKLYYPAALPEVIGVGAIDINVARADFSNYGEAVSEIYAPGVDIVSTIPQYEVYLFEWSPSAPPYGKIDGTSFSSPMAAGAAVLLKSHDPSLGPADIMQRLFSTAIPLGTLDEDKNGVDDHFGYGLLNPVAALSPPILAGSEYFDLGVSGSPIFEDDVYVFVRVKKAITGNPIVKYVVDATDEEGDVPVSKVGNGNFYMGSFKTTWNGQIRVSVTGMVGGEPLPPLNLLYVIKDL